jgi:hypothetical protein
MATPSAVFSTRIDTRQRSHMDREPLSAEGTPARLSNRLAPGSRMGTTKPRPGARPGPRLDVCVAGQRETRRSTLPALRQEVQTRTRCGVPLMTVRTDWMFGRNMRGVRDLTRRFNAFLPKRATLRPKPGSFAQISQRADTVDLP